MARQWESIEEWELYVPNVDDGSERQLYAVEPQQAITAELKYMSKREREHMSRLAQKAEKDAAARKRVDAEFRRIMNAHVRDIRNVTIGDENITTGAQLYDSDCDDLKQDFTTAFLNRGRLEDGLGKRLSTPSASLSSRQTGSAGGDAQDVTTASSQDS